MSDWNTLRLIVTWIWLNGLSYPMFTSGAQLGDILTKALFRKPFSTLCNKVDMIDIYAPAWGRVLRFRGICVISTFIISLYNKTSTLNLGMSRLFSNCTVYLHNCYIITRAIFTDTLLHINVHTCLGSWCSVLHTLQCCKWKTTWFVSPVARFDKHDFGDPSVCDISDNVLLTKHYLLGCELTTLWLQWNCEELRSQRNATTLGDKNKQ